MPVFDPIGRSAWLGLIVLRALCLAIALSVVTTHSTAQTSPSPKSADHSTRRGQSGNLVGHGGPVKAIATDGSHTVTGSFDYSAIVWTHRTSKPPQRLLDHNGAVNAVAFVPGRNQVLTAGDDSSVVLWDIETGQRLHRFLGHDAGSKIVGLSVSRDGKWAVSAGWDRTARLWNLDTRAAGPVLRDHRGPVNAAVFAEGDAARVPNVNAPAATHAVYTASYDGDVRAFSMADGAFLRRIHAAGQSVNVLITVRDEASTSAFSASALSASALSASARRDTLLFGTVSGASGVLDAVTGDILKSFPDLDRPILSAADGLHRVAIGSGDGRIRVFEKRDWILEHEHRAAFGPVWALAFTRNPSDEPSALYHAGLDDFVTYWLFTERPAFDHVDTSKYPRRFQVIGQTSSASVDTPIARGEIQFARKCSICHTLTPDSANRAGPTLHRIFGRRIATLPGYAYSPELKTLDITWTPATLSKLFEIGPDKFTPGSKMPLQVMTDRTERDDLVAYLQIATHDGAGPVDDPDASPQKTP